MKQISPSVRRQQCANVGVGILIFLSICLCLLSVFQWVVQTRLRTLIQEERLETNKLRGERQDLENKSKRYSDEIAHITEMRTRLEEERKTNLVELRQKAQEVVRLRNDYMIATNYAIQFSNALAQANTNIALQNKRIEEAAGLTKKAMEERNDIAIKFNEKVHQYAELITNYNTLAGQFQDFQKQVKEMMEKQAEKK